MGFFSSRKAEDNDNYITTTTTAVPAGEKSVVHVIRSRFYGKQKGKERAESSHSFVSNGTTVAQTLSSSGIHQPVASSPLASSSRHVNVGPSILRNSNTDRPLPPTPSRKVPPAQAPLPQTPSSARIRERSSERATPIKASDTPTQGKLNGKESLTPRKPIDTATATLAQRLNELATANSEGLLNDDEYRLLRQNLFERFSSTAIVPSEPSVVPAARPRPPKKGPLPESRPSSRPLSNFQVEVPRPSSIHSRNSIASGMTSLFNRATGKRTSTSNDFSETSSIWSATSNSSNIFRLPRMLSKKSSNSSIRTNTSRAQADTVSISSRRTGISQSDPTSPSTSGTRSAAGSIRRAAPPSSFPRSIGNDNKYAHNVSALFDEEHLKTTQEIQQEILNVEAEAKRLMDAFNGLQLTTLSKSQRTYTSRVVPKTPEAARSSYMDSADGRSQRRIVIAESDAMSIRSATSIGARSAYSGRSRVVRQKSLNTSLALNSSSRPGSLHRKNSSSSISSDWKAARNSIAPPVPALPAGYGQLSMASGSAVSLARSNIHLPMSAVPENDVDSGSVATHGGGEMEDDHDVEMEDIQRRREEVRMRYEARLEYLRAKLKGAQLHEKLLRK